MNLVREIEETRAQLLRTVNLEMDLLLDRLQNRSVDDNTSSVVNPSFESVYPLCTNIPFFKGKKPSAVIFKDGRRVDAYTWKQVASAILKDCINDHHKKAVLFSMRDKVIGNTRVILSKDGSKMTSPVEIDPELFVETHYDAPALLRTLTNKILDRVGYDYSRISIAVLE